MNFCRPTNLRFRVRLALLTAGIVLCVDGPREAASFEAGEEIDTKMSGPTTERISFAGRRTTGWLGINFEGSLFDPNPARTDSFGSSGFSILDKRALSDTHITFNLFDDRVRWTSRQANSSYVTANTNFGYLRQSEVGYDNSAISQRVEASLLNTGTTRLSLFTEYARVGASFSFSDGAIKRQDIFSKPNTMTTRVGANFGWGPLSMTLEERSEQKLTSDNPPIQTQKIGFAFSVKDWASKGSIIPENTVQLLPSSIWFNVGQGKMKAPLIEGIAGDSTSDLSVGSSWSLGKFYASLGYWSSNYQSQLYPWRGSAINGSLGFQDGLWQIDMYLDLGRSTYGLVGVGQAAVQNVEVTSGIRFRSSLN